MTFLLTKWHVAFTTTALILLLASPGVADDTAQGNRSPEKPNVIYILADDLGAGDLSCFGQTKFTTPNIDELANKGIRFTQHYSGSAVCAPSRCALMTGLHTGHAPVRGNGEIEPEGQRPMPADTFTVAHLMKKAGYRTGAFGKWGLGGPGTVSTPEKMGFDRFYGYNCQRQAHNYYPQHLWSDNNRELLPKNANDQQVTYAPDVIHKQAIQFVRANKDKPFFCYYAAIQPHADMVAPERYMKKHRGKYGIETPHEAAYYRQQDTPRAAFAAMINVLDDYVGEIVSELESLGIAENTLIIFSSDNGPHTEGGHDPEFFDSNGIYQGVKRDTYDGGIHVPMVASWPGTIPAGLSSDHLSAFWDFLPTMADLVNVKLDSPTDGVSMLPTLLNQTGQKQHDYLYWECPFRNGRIAIRKGNWKAVRYNASINPNSPLELYDMSGDPSETIDVSREYPQITSSMRELLKDVRTVPDEPHFDYLRIRKSKKKKTAP